MILHICYEDAGGGAGIAAYRHCEAMRRVGIDARFLVIKRHHTASPFVTSLISSKRLQKVQSALLGLSQSFLKERFGWKNVFSYPIYGVHLSHHPWVREAEVIYLHWVAGGMMTNREVSRLLRMGKSVRWFMHDMQPITGGCHHALTCEGYKADCSCCPMLPKKPLGLNLAKRQLAIRKRLWDKYPNLEAYTPSRWLASCVEASSLWKERKVFVFPNVIDTDKFHFVDKQTARRFLGIHSERKLILFGAVGIDNAYKGWNYLRDALQQLDPEQYEAVIFGNEQLGLDKELGITCHFLGFLSDEYSLILAYNAADVFVSSSLAENYPNVIIEAMACGLPCIGFNIGGIPEQIDHLRNGYLAEARNPQSLADGIHYICSLSEEEYAKMQKEARRFVEETVSYKRYNKSLKSHR